MKLIDALLRRRPPTVLPEESSGRQSLPAASEEDECEPRRGILLTRNSKKDPFPSVTAARLGIGKVPAHALVEVEIVAPFQRTVLGRANDKGNRIYLNVGGWEPGDRESGWPATIDVIDVTMVEEAKP